MSQLDQQIKAIWANPPGFLGWLTQVNHRSVGARFMVTAFVFFLVAGVEALFMRAQLARPRLELLHPETYNQLFTMHGSTMMFLFAVPFLEGLTIYVVPLMIGTRDMAFPRLNAYGYWVFLFAGVAIHWGLLTGSAPNAGWFNYPPLAGPGFSVGQNIDYWVIVITMLEFSALAAAVELIVTIFKQRTPGMSLGRMPLLVWGALVMAFMIVFAMPPLIVTSLFLALDRLAGTHFFNVAAGGEPLLWQHLFWFFGHPDVYIILVPALGIVAAVVEASARRSTAGYTLVVASFVAIGILSFGLWVHHMYAAGLPLLGMNFFAAASMLVTVPSAIAIFAWIVTIARGRPVFQTHFLFAAAFLVIFILGGITGIMVAAVPFDWQVHDTYFVVAHFHYVLIGGVVLPIFAAIYFWFPKITGRRLSEALGKAHFGLFFVGLNLTFFPMHILGLEGMPRRNYTFLPGLGWERDNLLATLGAGLLGFSILIFLINLGWSRLFGARAGDNPWYAATLEWATSSPPPPFNFRYFLRVRGLTPLWTDDRARVETIEIDDPTAPARETLVTTGLDAAPDHRMVLPGPSIWPLALAAATALGFLGAMVSLVFVPLGGVLAFGALVGWHWARLKRT
jgi:cytochrome c oxidase subunit I+III